MGAGFVRRWRGYIHLTFNNNNHNYNQIRSAKISSTTIHNITISLIILETTESHVSTPTTEDTPIMVAAEVNYLEESILYVRVVDFDEEYDYDVVQQSKSINFSMKLDFEGYYY